MPRRVLDVGNCAPDYATMRSFLASRFDCEVAQVHGREDTLAELKRTPYDLVLVNRKLDQDYSDGIEIIRAIKADPELSTIPVMLITNYPQHQDAAEAIGALRGFGKLEYDRPETLQQLQSVLGEC